MYAGFIELASDLYDGLITEGVAPELARFILPQSMMTKFYMTGNLRSWANFLALRLDSHAQVEAQDLAKQVYCELKCKFPYSIDAMIEAENPNVEEGREEVHKPRADTNP